MHRQSHRAAVQDFKTFERQGVRIATQSFVTLDINLFDNPWYAALQSSAVGNANFGRVNTQANYSRTLQFTARFSF